MLDVVVFVCIVLFSALLYLLYLFRRTAYKRISRKAIAQNSTHAVYRSRKKPAWVLKEVLRLKALMGRGAGCRSVAITFNRLHSSSGHSVGKTFVCDAIRTHQYEVVCLRREMRAKHPVPVAVNQVWAMDLTFVRDSTDVQHTVLGIVDHGSRLCTQLVVLANKRSWTVLGHLCLAIGQYGKPRAIRTDNEALFKSWVFTKFLKLVGIDQQSIPTCAPWCNGRVERMFGTFKPWLAQVQFAGGVALQVALLQAKWFYNEVRPHQSLGGLTPAEWFAGLRAVDLRQGKFEAILVSTLAGVLRGVWLRPVKTHRKNTRVQRE